MGCKYCTWACPYDAPKYNKTQGTTEKCTFCSHRLKENENPACVMGCPTGALKYKSSDLDDDAGEKITTGFSETGIKPSIQFKELRKKKRGPENTMGKSTGDIEDLFLSAQPVPHKKITLKAEWALFLFTTIAYLLVSFFTASLFGKFDIHPLFFLGSGVLAMGLTTGHLGKKSRAYRAIFNLRRSWLSREILFFSLFMGLAGLSLLFFPGSPIINWAAVITGFISLFSIDKIYQVAMKLGPLNFHSGHVLLNGFFLTGFLVDSTWIFLIFAVIKSALYLNRKFLSKKSGNKINLITSLSRITFGFLIPLIYFFSTGADWNAGIMGWGATIMLIAGEFLDRGEYYNELEVITPEKQMLMDLKAMLRKS